MRKLIDIKQIDVSKLNDVKIYDELPLEVEGQVAYCTGDGKLYYGDGSEWKKISTREVNPNDIILDTTNFDKNLDTTITDVQKLADAVDDLEVTGGGSLPIGECGQTLKYNENNELVSTSTLTINDTNVNVNSELIIDKMTSAFSDLLFTVKSRSVDILGETWFEIKADGGLYAKTLVGSGDRAVFADENGKLKIGTASSTGREYIEHLSTSLSGTEYNVSRETLGITGDLRERIKFMQVWIKNASGGDYRTVAGQTKYIAADFVSVDFGTSLDGNFVKIYIEIN